MPEPKSRRIPHPIWFGILALLMVLLAVFLPVWLPYHREQVVIREIERLGGKVEVELYEPQWWWDAPEWLQEIVADGWLSWFDEVVYVYVHLGNTQINDEGLKHLSGLTYIQSLRLDNTQVSDEGMKHISGLINLRDLILDNTQVANEGLKHLSGLTDLETLYLDNTQVTDEGVKELQKALPDCEIYH
jgi:hypothetical protein